MYDAEAEFRRLRLVGSMMRDMRATPKRRLSVTFTNFGDAAGGAEPGQYDIQFNKIQDFRLDLPWRGSRVTAHDVLTSSEYLNAAFDRPILPLDESLRHKLRHFRIVFEVGRLDILAQNFVVSSFQNDD